MDTQTVVMGIESIAKDISDLRQLSSIINDFFKTPHSKSEIRNFAEKYLLDNFLTATELRTLYSQLTIEKTILNNDITRFSIANSDFTLKQSLNKFRLKIKKCLSNVLILLAEFNNDVVEGALPNKAELLKSLFDKLIKIDTIFQTARQIPIDVDQIDSLPVNEELKEYSLPQLITFQKDAFNSVIANLDFTDLLSIGSNSTYVVNPYLCKNNWISLRNLIISLNNI